MELTSYKIMNYDYEVKQTYKEAYTTSICLLTCFWELYNDSLL